MFPASEPRRVHCSQKERFTARSNEGLTACHNEKLTVWLNERFAASDYLEFTVNYRMKLENIG